MAQKNSWRHIFAIPINSEEKINCTKLEAINNQRIECGGLEWNIYFHRGQTWSSSKQKLFLAVFPINNYQGNVLPRNYTMRYTVTAKLMSRRTDSVTINRGMASTQHEWTAQYDPAKHRSVSADYKNKELLPFTKKDLIDDFCDDGEDYFYLQISIRTVYKRDKETRSKCSGILGAILLQFESEVAKDFASQWTCYK